jgi:DNA-binding NarL/FixJ family response regulator
LSTRILVVDDRSDARTAIRSLLDLHGLRVCGEASDGKEAIKKVRELRPGIILLDINMPEMNGVEAACKIRRISPATKIVFLTIHDTPGLVRNFRMYSDGLVAKSEAQTKLIPTLLRLIENSKGQASASG